MDPFFHIWSHSQQNVTNLDLNSCGMVFVKLGNEDDISSWIFFCFVVRLELNCFYFVLIYELCQASNNRTIHCLKGTNIPSFSHSFKPQQSKTIHLQLNWKITDVFFFWIFCRIGKENARHFAKSSSQLVFFPPKKVATSQAPPSDNRRLAFLDCHYPQSNEIIGKCAKTHFAKAQQIYKPKLFLLASHVLHTIHTQFRMGFLLPNHICMKLVLGRINITSIMFLHSSFNLRQIFW